MAHLAKTGKPIGDSQAGMGLINLKYGKRAACPDNFYRECGIFPEKQGKCQQQPEQGYPVLVGWVFLDLYMARLVSYLTYS